LALNRQKAKLPHGIFLPWIETEFEMHEQSARRFMQVADRFGKSNTMLDLTPTALYELAAPSTPPEVQAEVARTVSRAEVRLGPRASVCVGI
jgi:hypothetical protein